MIMRIVIAVIVSLFMSWIGLALGQFINAEHLSVVFTVVTMGAFIIYEIQRSKKAD